jgi:hypothetical protein
MEWYKSLSRNVECRVSNEVNSSIALCSLILAVAHLPGCSNDALAISCSERLLDAFRRNHNFVSMNRALLVSVSTFPADP